MHREIRAFSQHVQGIIATIGHFCNNNTNNNNNNEDVELTTHKRRYISPKERQKIINELSLVPKKDDYF